MRRRRRLMRRRMMRRPSCGQKKPVYLLPATGTQVYTGLFSGNRCTGLFWPIPQLVHRSTLDTGLFWPLPGLFWLAILGAPAATACPGVFYGSFDDFFGATPPPPFPAGLVLLDDIYLNEAMDRVWGTQGARPTGTFVFLHFFLLALLVQYCRRTCCSAVYLLYQCEFAVLVQIYFLY